MAGRDGAIEDVLEPGQLRHRFGLRAAEHILGKSLRDDLPSLKHQGPLSQGKYLVAIMGDVKDRCPVLLVPGAQIIYNSALRSGIEGG